MPILVPWGMSPWVCFHSETRFYLYTELGFYWSEKTDSIQSDSTGSKPRSHEFVYKYTECGGLDKNSLLIYRMTLVNMGKQNKQEYTGYTVLLG